MSDSELSDGIDELQEIMAEYAARAQVMKENEKDVKKEVKPKMSSLQVPMDKVIFGDKAGLMRKFAQAVGDESTTDDEVDEEVQQVVKKEKSAVDTEEADTVQVDATVTKHKANKRKPVWTDADDDEIQVGQIKRETKYTGPLDHLRKDKSYKEYLTNRFTRIVAQPKWANLDRPQSEANEDDEQLLQTVGFLAKAPPNALQPQTIQIKQLKDLNRASYAEGSISSVSFHPSSTAALVCGSTGVATIYAIDGRKNDKLHSIGFRDYPIRCARIMPNGTQAIFGSNKRYFYSYDLLSAQETRHKLPKDITKFHKFEISPCGRYLALNGRFGEMHLLDAVSKEFIHTFKQENPVAVTRFTADSKRIICNSKSNDISVFDLRSQRLQHSFIDEGCISGHAFDLAPNQRMLATGSMEGVVNIYDLDKALSERAPTPIKRVMNLTTAIACVKFNHSSELLAISSAEVNAGVKLVHFPSGTVYANFPGFKSDIGKIGVAEFSPASGYLALGNRQKEVALYRVKHYNNY